MLQKCYTGKENPFALYVQIASHHSNGYPSSLPQFPATLLELSGLQGFGTGDPAASGSEQWAPVGQKPEQRPIIQVHQHLSGFLAP